MQTKKINDIIVYTVLFIYGINFIVIGLKVNGVIMWDKYCMHNISQQLLKAIFRFHRSETDLIIQIN